MTLDSIFCSLTNSVFGAMFAPCQYVVKTLKICLLISVHLEAILKFCSDSRSVFLSQHLCFPLKISYEDILLNKKLNVAVFSLLGSSYF